MASDTPSAAFTPAGPSPYAKPSLRAVGSNDGGSTYGWGLYANADFAVAKTYADTTNATLARRIAVGGVPIDEQEGAVARIVRRALLDPNIDARALSTETLRAALERNEEDIRKTFAVYERSGKNPRFLESLRADIATYEEIAKRGLSVEPAPPPAIHEQLWWAHRAPGDETHLLDWDKPLSTENRARLLEAIDSLGLDPSKLDASLRKDWLTRNMKGKNAYQLAVLVHRRLLENFEGNPEQAASALLYAHGIDGVKAETPYGTPTYVSFSDEHLQVTRRWLWNAQTQAFELDRSFTPPPPTEAETRTQAEATLTPRSSISGVNPAETSARQKDAHGVYPDASEDIARASIGARRQQEYRAIIAKHRPNLPQEEVDRFMDELGKLGNTKAEKAALHWFVKGALELPEDNEKLKTALSLAEKFKIDPLQCDSPLALAEEADRRNPKKQKEAYIDPDTVPELTNKRDLGDGLVIYDVEDSEAGQAAMRRIMNSHLGRDANGEYWSPWCLLTPTVSGGVSESAKNYWGDYNKSGRGAAFYKGKLVAFQSSKYPQGPEWWDMDDHSHRGWVPYTKEVPAREAGWDDVPEEAVVQVPTETNQNSGETRALFAEVDEATAGDKQNGEWRLWVLAPRGHRLDEIANYKDGKLDGPRVTYINTDEGRPIIESYQSYKEGKPSGQGFRRNGIGNLAERTMYGAEGHAVTVKYWRGDPEAVTITLDKNTREDMRVNSRGYPLYAITTKGEKAVREEWNLDREAVNVAFLEKERNPFTKRIYLNDTSEREELEAYARKHGFSLTQRTLDRLDAFQRGDLEALRIKDPFAGVPLPNVSAFEQGQGGTRSSIVGRPSTKRPPIEAKNDAARTTAFNAAQTGQLDARQRVFVADVPIWAAHFGFHGSGITANGTILRKLHDKHGLTAEAFNALINAIKRPVAVLFERHFKSGKPELAIFTDVITKARDGRMAPTMIVLVQERDHLEIASAYAPDAIMEERKAATMNTRALLLADKKRAQKLPLLAATKLALASFNLASGPSSRTIAYPKEEVNTRNAGDLRSALGGIERGARAASLYFGRAPAYRDLTTKTLAETALFATGKRQTAKSVREAYQSFGVNVSQETAAVIADRINDDIAEQQAARRNRLKPGEQPRDRAFGTVDALAKATKRPPCGGFFVWDERSISGF